MVDTDFYNASGEAIPPYAVMQIGPAVSVAGRWMTSVVKPDGTGTRYRLNGLTQIPVGATGRCYQAVQHTWARYNTAITPAFDEEWGPVSGSWDLTSGATGFIIEGGEHSGIVLVTAAPPGSSTDSTTDVATYSGCGCSCIDEPEAAIEVDGCPAPLALAMAPICALGTWIMVWNGSTWRSATRSIVCVYTTYCVYLEAAAAGTGTGDIVVTLKTIGGVTLQTWANAIPWNPLCAVRMTITGNPCSDCKFVPEPCLKPLNQGLIANVYGQCTEICYSDVILTVEVDGAEYPCEYLINADVLVYEGSGTWRGEGTGPCGVGEWVLTISGGIATVVHYVGVDATSTWITIGTFDPLCTISLVNVENFDCECDTAQEVICVHPRDTICTSCTCPTGRTWTVTVPQGVDVAANSNPFIGDPGPTDPCYCGTGFPDVDVVHSSLSPLGPTVGVDPCRWVGEHIDAGCHFYTPAAAGETDGWGCRVILFRDSAFQITVTIGIGPRPGPMWTWLGYAGTAGGFATYRITSGVELGCDGPWTLNLIAFDNTKICNTNWPATITIT